MTRTKLPYTILERAYSRLIEELINRTDEPDDLYDLTLTYRSYSGVTITFSWREHQERLENDDTGGL